MFTLILGEMIPFDEHIFLGWFNHQLVLNLISGCVPNWPKWFLAFLSKWLSVRCSLAFKREEILSDLRPATCPTVNVSFSVDSIQKGLDSTFRELWGKKCVKDVRPKEKSS